MAWNPNIEGRLCSGSADGLVCLWDVESAPQLDDSNGHRYINPLMTLEKHTNVVEDVAWHHESNNLLTSVGDDKVQKYRLNCTKIDVILRSRLFWVIFWFYLTILDNDFVGHTTQRE